MQKIILLSVGGLKTSWIVEGCSEYQKRLSHLTSFELIEVPASKNPNPDKQVAQESQLLLERLQNMKGKVVVLDERGVELSSLRFAENISQAKNRGETLIFLLGGAYGFNDSARDRADLVLRLSAMTFPHELCRLVLLEQLYRALEIGKKSGYHH